MVEQNISYYVKCSCYSHTLETERYCDEWDLGNGKDKRKDEGFNFTVWGRGVDGKRLNWRERFRWCWHILKTGMPWADGIIATNEQARGLAEFIQENLPKQENEETKTNK